MLSGVGGAVRAKAGDKRVAFMAMAMIFDAFGFMQISLDGNGGYAALNLKDSSYGKFDVRMYEELISDHPIDLCRYQVANCYMGRIGLINSGGASGKNDLADAVSTAVINKRAGGMGLITGRKAFQHPFEEGVSLLNAIQDVYLDTAVTIP